MSIKVNIGKLKRMGAKIGCGFPDNCQKLSLLDKPPRVARAYLMTLSLKQAIMNVNWKNPLLSISAYLQLRFPFLEGQRDLWRGCWQEWLRLTRNKATNLLENTLLQDLPRYEDWTTTQVHLYQQESELFVFIDRWREIPRHLPGSWHVEEGGWFASLFAAKLQQGRVQCCKWQPWFL